MNKASNQRVSLSVYFMLLGFLFASWASRIPSIKSNFNFDEAQLGSLLLVMPISSLIGLPISGWLVSKFNSRIPLLISFIILSLSLPIIGFATNVQQLVVGVALFSFCTRIANIAVNTQSITLQKQREKKNYRILPWTMEFRWTRRCIIFNIYGSGRSEYGRSFCIRCCV